MPAAPAYHELPAGQVDVHLPVEAPERLPRNGCGAEQSRGAGPGPGARWRAPHAHRLSVWPLTSYRLAVRLHNEVPGIVVPNEVQSALEGAGKGARKVGFETLRRHMRQVEAEVFAALR